MFQLTTPRKKYFYENTMVAFEESYWSLLFVSPARDPVLQKTNRCGVLEWRFSWFSFLFCFHIPEIMILANIESLQFINITSLFLKFLYTKTKTTNPSQRTCCTFKVAYFLPRRDLVILHKTRRQLASLECSFFFSPSLHGTWRFG